jgi:hypothetical protein
VIPVRKIRPAEAGRYDEVTPLGTLSGRFDAAISGCAGTGYQSSTEIVGAAFRRPIAPEFQYF